MYAIVEIAGQQFKVEKGKKIFVHHLDAENGTKVDFDRVLLIDDDGKITIGEPVIKDAIVEGKVLDHIKGDKVIVFKKKRRKGYRVKKGHRQNFSQIEILSIGEKKLTRKEPEKKEKAAPEKAAKSETAAKEKSIEKKPATKKRVTEKVSETPKKAVEKKPEVKKPATKISAAKKPAVKKPAAGKTGEKKDTKSKSAK